VLKRRRWPWAGLGVRPRQRSVRVRAWKLAAKISIAQGSRHSAVRVMRAALGTSLSRMRTIVTGGTAPGVATCASGCWTTGTRSSREQQAARAPGPEHEREQDDAEDRSAKEALYQAGLCAARAAGGEHRRGFSEALRAARGAAGVPGCPGGLPSAPDRAEMLPHAPRARLGRPAGPGCGLLRGSVYAGSSCVWQEGS